jgi:hypothetical protein
MKLTTKLGLILALLSNNNGLRGLQNAIIGLLAGEPMPRVLMTVIRYCVIFCSSNFFSDFVLIVMITPSRNC